MMTEVYYHPEKMGERRPSNRRRPNGFFPLAFSVKVKGKRLPVDVVFRPGKNEIEAAKLGALKLSGVAKPLFSNKVLVEKKSASTSTAKAKTNKERALEMEEQLNAEDTV